MLYDVCFMTYIVNQVIPTAIIKSQLTVYRLLSDRPNLQISDKRNKHFVIVNLENIFVFLSVITEVNRNRLSTMPMNL